MTVLTCKNILPVLKTNVPIGYHTISGRWIFEDYKIAFNTYKYPACCGISILADFSSSTVSKKQIKDALRNAFTKDIYANPTIQLVAVKNAIIDELDDSPTGEYEPQYNFNNFIEAIMEEFEAKIIHTFVNKNSKNMCHVIQFNNPRYD
jgi:hypothetical protein